MCRQTDLGNFIVLGSVDHCQGTVTVADHHMLPRSIHTHVVGIISEIDPAACGVARALKQSQRSVATIGDIERVGARQVTDALRLLEPGKNLEDLALPHVDYSDR